MTGAYSRRRNKIPTNTVFTDNSRSLFGFAEVWTAVLFCLFVFAAPAFSAESEWVESYKVRSRLVAGHAVVNDKQQPLAFVQLEFAPGWKTYWRHPGEAGGIPPEFSWAGSENLSSANVLFPAPKRLTDRAGDAVGYKNRVIFPVKLIARNQSQPISLTLDMRFGICKEICVPAEAMMKVDVPAVAEKSLPRAFTEALERVPRRIEDKLSGDPLLAAVSVSKGKGGAVDVELVVTYPETVAGADLFLEAPAGLFIPVPKRRPGGNNNSVSFEIELTTSEYLDLKGKALTATMVGKSGQAEADFKIE